MSHPNRNSLNGHTSLPAIILVERDAVTLELYQRELCKSFTVFALTELKGVMEVVTSQDIRAVIIEPEIDSGKGWELVHSIHEALPGRFIPVIVCSTRDARASGLAVEVTKYLTKPVLPQILREKTLEVVKEKGRSRKTE